MTHCRPEPERRARRDPPAGAAGRMSAAENGDHGLPGGFRFSDLPTTEIERLESELAPLAESVRALVDATIRTTVDLDQIRRARAEIDAVTARLRSALLPGPAGV